MEAAVPLAQMKQIAARAAHDIRNPLAGISNSFYLIKDAIPTTHPYYSYVGTIEREIMRLADVTRRLVEAFDQAEAQGPAKTTPESTG
jgi:signal transduction histidine kinase